MHRREHLNSSFSFSFIWGLGGDFDAGTLCKDLVVKFYGENLDLHKKLNRKGKRRGFCETSYGNLAELQVKVV